MEDKFIRKPTQDNFVTEKVDIYKNNLLGEYDSNGNYAIAPQIVQELISLTKVRKNSYDNSIFCFGNLLGYGEIAFEVSFDKNRDSENKAKASLYVLEDVDKVNGYLQNIIKTKLADFVSNVDDFIEEAYSKFNVINEGEEDEGREKKNLDELELDDNSYILAKRAYMLLLDKLSSEKMLDSYGKYFTARLTNLTKMENGFSSAVLDMFNEKYELIEEIFLKEKNYKALNELLDSCIEGVSGTKESYIAEENQFNEIMSEYLNEFTESVNKLNGKAEQKAFGMLDPNDRNKMTQMNATFENSSGDTPVTFEEVEDDGRQIENSIDESFQSPVIDTVEAFEQPMINSISEEEEEKVEESSEETEEAQTTEGEATDQNAQDNIIKHILEMQAKDDGELTESTEEIESEMENDISEEYVSSNADFQKSRQNDRLNNISDRLSKLSEISDNIEQNDASAYNQTMTAESAMQEEVEQPIERQEVEQTIAREEVDVYSNDNASYPSMEEPNFEKVINTERTEDVGDYSAEEKSEEKLNKDRFSTLFSYLENKQDNNEMDRDDFSR